MAEHDNANESSSPADLLHVSDIQVTTPPDATQLLPAVLKPPQGIEPVEVQKAEDNAQLIVARIIEDPEDRDALRSAVNLGEGVQGKANDEFKLLRTSMGRVMERMKQTGQSTSIPNDLKQLREVMDSINPYPAIEQIKKARTAGFFSRLLRSVPGVGKILADIARRYESVQTQIDVIIQSLESGTDKLLENSLELEERYKNLKNLQQTVKLGAYELQFVLKKVDEAKPRVSDPLKQQALAKAEAKVVRRLQNLKVTENAFAQFFVTMNVTLDNHENLREAVRSMIDLVRPVLENGLALQIAQQDEKQIAEALESTQDYLGQLMVNVAEESMDNAAQVARVANQPLARFQDLIKAYKILTTRMDEAQKVENAMIAAARKNIDQLEVITSDLEKRAESQEIARESTSTV